MNWMYISGDYSLQINSVSLEDDAVFQCQVGAADGIRGIRSRSASFTVFAPPELPVIVQARAQGEYLRTTAGMTVELTCEAHGGKPPAEVCHTCHTPHHTCAHHSYGPPIYAFIHSLIISFQWLLCIDSTFLSMNYYFYNKIWFLLNIWFHFHMNHTSCHI